MGGVNPAATSTRTPLLILIRALSNPCHGLPGGVYTIQEHVTGPAGWAAHLQPSCGRLHYDFVHQTEVPVRRTVKLKHQLAAEHTVLPASSYIHGFCHDDSNPATRCNSSAPNGSIVSRKCQGQALKRRRSGEWFACSGSPRTVLNHTIEEPGDVHRRDHRSTGTTVGWRRENGGFSDRQRGV